jgi:hypothetical protein
MFHGNGAHELGYANAAVLTALLRTLVREKVLTERMAEDVLRDGIKILQSNVSNDSVARAIKFIETSLFNAFWKSQNDAA